MNTKSSNNPNQFGGPKPLTGLQKFILIIVGIVLSMILFSSCSSNSRYRNLENNRPIVVDWFKYTVYEDLYEVGDTITLCVIEGLSNGTEFTFFPTAPEFAGTDTLIIIDGEISKYIKAIKLTD